MDIKKKIGYICFCLCIILALSNIIYTLFLNKTVLKITAVCDYLPFLDEAKISYIDPQFLDNESPDIAQSLEKSKSIIRQNMEEQANVPDRLLYILKADGSLYIFRGLPNAKYSLSAFPFFLYLTGFAKTKIEKESMNQILQYADIVNCAEKQPLCILDPQEDIHLYYNETEWRSVDLIYPKSSIASQSGMVEDEQYITSLTNIYRIFKEKYTPLYMYDFDSLKQFASVWRRNPFALFLPLY